MEYLKVPYFLFPFKYHRDFKSKIITEINNQESSPHDDIFDTDWKTPGAPYFDIFAQQFISEVDKRFSKYVIGKWQVGQVWYQRYKKGDKHPWHKHGNCHWTCVYYVSLPNDAPGTLIKDPYTNNIVNLQQREGDICIFPSLSWHCSPELTVDKEKLVISLNIDLLD